MNVLPHLFAPRLLGFLLAGLAMACAPESPASGTSGGSTSPAAVELGEIATEVLQLDREPAPRLPVPEGVDARYSNRLRFASETHLQEQVERAQALLERLDTLDRSGLTTAERVDAFVAEHRLRNRIADWEFGARRVPVTDAGGFHEDFARQAAGRTLEDAADVDDYIAELQSFLEFTRHQIAYLREGIAAGNTLPRASLMEDWEGTVRDRIVDDPRESVFFEPLRTLPAELPEAERERALREGEAAILESVLPAYRQLLAFVEESYLPALRDEEGLWSVPGGVAYYEHRVRHFTTLDLSPQEIHQIGLDEVARLRDEMREVMRETGFQGEFDAFVEYLRNEPRFYLDDPEEYIRHAAMVAKRVDGELPTLFLELPKTPYGVRFFPETADALRATGANYSRGAPGERAGFYQINPVAIETRALYALEALTLHEGMPGHHLQIMLHLENDEISELRRATNMIAFNEGWALYAERLGLEMGFYTDPYSNFGRLGYEIWRAGRLVVDTGIHALGWSRQEAIDYLAANTALSLHHVTTEIDRYIRNPGQALAYKIGELEISQQRRRAEEALGERFDVREFHRAVLHNGSIPLSFLDDQIGAYIEDSR